MILSSFVDCRYCGVNYNAITFNDNNPHRCLIPDLYKRINELEQQLKHKGRIMIKKGDLLRVTTGTEEEKKLLYICVEDTTDDRVHMLCLSLIFSKLFFIMPTECVPLSDVICVATLEHNLSLERMIKEFGVHELKEYMMQHPDDKADNKIDELIGWVSTDKPQTLWGYYTRQGKDYFCDVGNMGAMDTNEEKIQRFLLENHINGEYGGVI